jgi:hypothetical protein
VLHFALKLAQVELSPAQVFAPVESVAQQGLAQSAAQELLADESAQQGLAQSDAQASAVLCSHFSLSEQHSFFSPSTGASPGVSPPQLTIETVSAANNNKLPNNFFILNNFS